MVKYGCKADNGAATPNLSFGQRGLVQFTLTVALINVILASADCGL